MAQSKFTLYKYIKLADGSWRYCKAAFYSNGKIKPNRCIVDGKEEEHPEGAYYLYHKKNWIPVGADALEAQRRRNARLDEEEFKRLRGTALAPSPTALPTSGRFPLAVAAVLVARNKTRPRRFFLPGNSFVTVRQFEDCSRAVHGFFCGKQSPPFRDKHQTKRGVR
jgi:hypothetical protein